MVVELCSVLASEGLVPMLYVDSQNPDSNKVYRKIGFRGKRGNSRYQIRIANKLPKGTGAAFLVQSPLKKLLLRLITASFNELVFNKVVIQKLLTDYLNNRTR
ncbi:hypothetical protein EJP82_08370 [Paenibacillus anaericanus]|uniref:Uncharacterized protein n=1 Tax=Paenibacillus anaericanus TaxID=170367 RepID=A0A433YBS1_9BACL|nr:hypothetical protein EJP82_08370 [Paenibacillus anaericanus]